MSYDPLAERVVARFTASGPTPLADEFRASIIKAVKRVGDGVRAMGLGSVVKYNPQEEIREDRYGGTHGTFFLRFEHDKINRAYHPGINFYWDPSKESGTVGTSNLVWPAKDRGNLPLNKMGHAMLDAADDILKDLKRQLGETESEETWSVVTLGKDHGYATEVDTFPSKAKAEAEARHRGNCYVVKGTQMWNEPLGQVEEHDRPAPSKFFR